MEQTNSINKPLSAGRKSLNDLLAQVFEQPIAMGEEVKVNRKIEVEVRRVHVELLDGSSTSVIVKHIPFNDPFYKYNQECHPALLNEMQAYELLMQCQGDCLKFPRLLGRTAGIMILQDLGQDTCDFLVPVEAQKALIKSIAGLHAATSGKKRAYDGLKKADKKSASNYRKLSFHDNAQQYEVGIDFLKNKTAGEKAIKLAKHIESYNAIGTVENPGVFQALLHNDLNPRSQIVNKEYEFYLFDFEHSLFSHALLDFWSLYVGKVEYNRSQGIYFRKKLKYFPGIEREYRKHFENSLQLNLSNEFWKLHLSGTLTYAISVMIGKLILMPEYVNEYKMNVEPLYDSTEEINQLYELADSFLTNTYQ